MQHYTFFENLTAAMVFISLFLMAAAAAKYLFPPKRKSNPEFDKLLEMAKPYIDRFIPKQDVDEGTDDLQFGPANSISEFIQFLHQLEPMDEEDIKELVQGANLFLQQKKCPYIIVKTNRGLIVKEL